MKNKKTIIAIISIVALLLVLLGVTYAYWLVTKTQTNSNIISSACLDITLDNETNDINLTSQYPMSDEDGMKLTPYTFTITNNCNTSLDYQVALESIGDEANAIKATSLKVALDTNADLLSNRASVSSTVNGAYAAHRLSYGTLSATGNEGSSVTHSLRIWIDENAPISEANKSFQSKISVTIGQGITNPYVEGTMAYDILMNNKGISQTPVIDSKDKKNTIITSRNEYIGNTNNYYYGTEYKLDTNTGVYALSGDIVQATLTECRSGSKTCGKYTFRNTSQNYNSSYLYEVIDFGNSGDNVMMNTIKYTNDFNSVVPEAGLYKATDDLGDSYYYRGNVTNNYVQFGSYTLEASFYRGCFDATDEASCDPTQPTIYGLEECEAKFPYCKKIVYGSSNDLMYWRIVRINGDGTIRLIYDGTEKKVNGESRNCNVIHSVYNVEHNNYKYAGYTYNNDDNTQISSSLKKATDTWYNTYLKNKYEEYIADGIFCNDKSGTILYFDDMGLETTKNNAEYFVTNWETKNRLNQATPKLTCARSEDRYTTDANLGNGLLTHPVGLLTADEAIFAGQPIERAGYYYSRNYYLNEESTFWSMTPISYNPMEIDFVVSWVVGDGQGLASDVAGVRPVINLRADVEFTGNGSYETPYVIKTN